MGPTPLSPWKGKRENFKLSRKSVFEKIEKKNVWDQSVSHSRQCAASVFNFQILEERSELMKKMDIDLEKHFKELEEKAIKRLEDGPKRMEGGWTEDNWEDQMSQHPFFNQVFTQTT